MGPLGANLEANLEANLGIRNHRFLANFGPPNGPQNLHYCSLRLGETKGAATKGAVMVFTT